MSKVIEMFNKDKKNKFVGFDSETSGTNVLQKHQILTAAFVKKTSELNVDDILDIKLQLKPDAVVSDAALLCNGLNPHCFTWNRSSISYDEGRKKIENFVLTEAGNDSLLIGMAYNSTFDCSFFDDMFKHNYVNFSQMFDVILDPWLLAKKLVNDKKIITKELISPKNNKPYKSTKLQDVAEVLGTQAKGAPHSALPDVLTMFNTMEAMWKIYANKSLYEATKEELAPFTIETKLLIEETEINERKGF